MDHIIEHEGQPVPEISGVSESTSSRVPMDVDDDEDAEALKSLGVVAGNEAEAKVQLIFQKISPAYQTYFIGKSIKCSECGKIFKNTALANFHAEKSGHDQFEESTDEVSNTILFRRFKAGS